MQNRVQSRCKLVQFHCNWTAIHRSELHQIAPDCTRLRSLRQKIKKEKIRAEERYSAPIYRPHLFACKVAEASRLLAGKVQRMDAAATFPGSFVPAPHKQSETLNLVGFMLIQLVDKIQTD
jgi:hypothetical protein